MSLDKALTLVIPNGVTRGMNDRDLSNLMQSYALAEKAKDCFLNREITFPEYLELLEQHQINIDSYLESIEGNLTTMRLI